MLLQTLCGHSCGTTLAQRADSQFIQLHCFLKHIWQCLSEAANAARPTLAQMSTAQLQLSSRLTNPQPEPRRVCCGGADSSQEHKQQTAWSRRQQAAEVADRDAFQARKCKPEAATNFELPPSCVHSQEQGTGKPCFECPRWLFQLLWLACPDLCLTQPWPHPNRTRPCPE